MMDYRMSLMSQRLKDIQAAMRQAMGNMDSIMQLMKEYKETQELRDMLAKRLKIANKWKLFEQLWHRNNMRNDYNTALNQRKSLEFQERMKKLLY
jgi:hypothetical protein